MARRQLAQAKVALARLKLLEAAEEFVRREQRERAEAEIKSAKERHGPYRSNISRGDT